MNLEYFFKGWLEVHECCQTERWDKLTVEERTLLLEHYWRQMTEMHPEIRALAEIEFGLDGNLAEKQSGA